MIDHIKESVYLPLSTPQFKLFWYCIRTFRQTISTFTVRINGTPFANCLGWNVLMPPQYAFGTDGRLLKVLRIKRINVKISRYSLGYNRSKYHIEGDIFGHNN